MRDRYLSRHVPVTEWYHEETLLRMLAYFPLLYVKPDSGSAGTGIIRIKRINRWQCLVSYGKKTDKCPNYRLPSEVRRRMLPRRKYMIQEGIRLATYRRKPFDLRVVLQRPAKRWLLTWMSAKVAPRSTSIVTNVAKGARDARIKSILRGAEPPLNAAHKLRELKSLSYKIAEKLGSVFPIRIVGLDMGIDKQGKIWYIEANTNPNFHGLKKLDPVQFRRYLKVKRLMKAKKLI